MEPRIERRAMGRIPLADELTSKEVFEQYQASLETRAGVVDTREEDAEAEIEARERELEILELED